jgi:aspartyl protease family protein
MNKIYSAFLLIFISFNSFAQNLSVNETLNYIKQQIQENKIQFTNGAGYRFYLENISFNISEEGIFKVNQSIRRFGNYPFGDEVYNSNESFDFRDVIAKTNDNEIVLSCKTGRCIQDLSNGKSLYAVYIQRFNIQSLSKIRNAFDYLFDILQYDERYNQKDNDPFSKYNYKNPIKEDLNTSRNINLDFNGILYTVKVNIGGEIVSMIFDTGASDISISTKLERVLIEKGILTKNNYLEPGLYKIADGSIVTSRRFKIPFIKVGGFEVKDIICNVNPSSDVLLLGKSFLNAFSKWSVDNTKHILTLEK